VVGSESPTVGSVETDLIDALTHEDDQWLWEPVWSLNSKYPAFPTAEKVALVRRVVLGLVAQKRVTLWQGQWPSGISGPLSTQGIERIAVEDPPWSDPEGTDLRVIVQLAERAT
jgi:hypothetical protein